MLSSTFVTLVALAAAAPVHRSARTDDAVVDLLAFGSCARTDRPQAIWPVIAAAEPDVLVLLGDNVYADLERVPEKPADIQAAYDVLAAAPGWDALRRGCRVLATWDDHDYGRNDAGAEWALKRESQRLFLDFFGVPEDSPRRAREGVYHAEVFGPPGRRVQVVLLDTRFHRDPLVRANERDPARGPYAPNDDPAATLLGAEQWAWLRAQLLQPAELRVLVSSIQVVADEHGWEGWGNFPHERARLFRLVDETNAAGVVVVSGDRHLLELSCERGAGVPYPLFDLTTSGLNEPERPVSEPNAHRVGPVLRRTNFGLLRIDWEGRVVALEGRGAEGEVLTSQLVWLDTLRE